MSTATSTTPPSSTSLPTTSCSPMPADAPSLNVAKHTKYFLRCLKTFLPTAYQSNDSNRMCLAFFIVCALDLLDALVPNTTPEQRAEYVDWIYMNQHPQGGFRAFPGTRLGEAATEENACWDPANLPATYFALASLLVLGDDMGRVKRRECLGWLGRLQRSEGSFGETLVDGEIRGGTDSRFGYCATAVRYMLRGTVEGEVDGVRDIDVDGLVRCIRAAETYDGGISEAPYHEAHAGFTYCGLGALSMLNRLQTLSPTSSPPTPHPTAPSSPTRLLHWLASRQTATITPEDSADTYADETDTPETCHDAHSFSFQTAFPSQQGKMSYLGRPTSHFALECVGVNGRCNKIADTCYAFWVGGSLDLLLGGGGAGQAEMQVLQKDSVRRWLLERTAHETLGGFGKVAGDLPDVYHSCLGLAALSLMGEEKVKELDAALCLSREAKGRLAGIWKAWGVEG